MIKETARRMLRTDAALSPRLHAKTWHLRHSIFLALEKVQEDEH